MIVECKNGFDEWCDSVGNWLDQNPTVYKVALIVNHVVRALMNFAMMVWMPMPLLGSAGLMLIPSLLYRASVERFCVFRFTLPSWAGGVAMSIAMISVSLGGVLLAGYIVMVMYISHNDVEERMARLKAGHIGCH